MTKIIPHRMEEHGKVRTDDYFWLSERENPEVLAYLETENELTAQAMAHTVALQETLFEEIKGRIKQEDSSVPYRLKDYYYYTRFEEGAEYEIYCRKPGTVDAAEEVMLDVNHEAEGKPYLNISSPRISSGQNLIAYGVDTLGNRIYTIQFKDLTSGQLLPDTLENTTGSVAWANDNKTCFYTRQEAETLRPNRIFRHVLGTDPNQDVLVYEETDTTFSVSVSCCKSRQYIFISSTQTVTSEYLILDANHPDGNFEVFLARERGHEYMLDHLGSYFYILTNHDAQNFQMFRATYNQRNIDGWEVVVPHREDTYIENFEVFNDYLVLEERRNALTHLLVLPHDGSPRHYLPFEEPAYVVGLGANVEPDTEELRFGYASMTTPHSTFAYNMGQRTKTLLKQTQVLGGFDQTLYRTERLHAPGHDGVLIPISLVYRIDKREPGKNPLLLYGYGAYGLSTDPSFSMANLSLLDRGIVYAIAHIRGGQEMGRSWYESGKLLQKRNTFLDFISCGQFLIEQKYADPHRLYARGGSAGGLLVGAVMNMAPELFHGVIAVVPFVDVLTTMLDASLPLTTGEYDEWGNPEEPTYYTYMASYSPYDNVIPRAYPHLLVTTGINDSQVQYWEPAKWVAKIKANRTNQNRCLLKTDLEVGHGGASGRFNSIKELAFYQAFLLDLAGLA